MVKTLYSRWTMEKTGQSFIDSESWGVVYYWKDCYGNVWIAENKWGWRVKL